MLVYNEENVPTKTSQSTSVARQQKLDMYFSQILSVPTNTYCALMLEKFTVDNLIILKWDNIDRSFGRPLGRPSKYFNLMD